MLRAPLRRGRESTENNPSKGAAKAGLTLSKQHGDGPLKTINGAQLNKIEVNPQKHAVIQQKDQASKELAQLEVSERVPIGDVEIKCTEYSADIYRYLVHHEKPYTLSGDYLAGGEPTNKMRRILVDWLVQVHGRFRLLPESLHLSIFILDHMLAKKLVVKSDLQLLGISSMFVASKFEEVYLPDVCDYEYITESTFKKKEILQMEQLILNSLQFDLSCPSSLVFGRCISRIISEDENSKLDNNAFFFAYNMSKYIGELAFLDSEMSCVHRSHIAMAAVSIALKLVHVDGIVLKDIERKMINQMSSSKAELDQAVSTLARVVLKQLKQEKLVAVKRKYQSSKLGQVSNLVNEEALAKIEALAAE